MGSGHKNHIITDHALLRYLERVEGIDVEQARRQASSPKRPANDHEVIAWLSTYGQHDLQAMRDSLVTPQLKMAIQAGARVVNRGDYRYVIRSSVVVTIKTGDWRRMRPRLRKGAARQLRYDALEAAE